MDITLDLPHWQLSSIFPGLESPEYKEAKAEVKRDLKALATFVDAHNIGTREGREVSIEDVAFWLGSLSVARERARQFEALAEAFA